MDNMNWNYPTPIWFGLNRVKEIQKACESLNIKNPLIVTDPGILQTDIINKINNNLFNNLISIASNTNIDGVVCSPADIIHVKDIASNFLYITPGIRLNEMADDHATIYTPDKAISAGSSYLVIGRPITEAKDPMSMVNKVRSLI